MSKLSKTLYLMLFLAAFLEACALGGSMGGNASASGDNTFAPQPGDETLVRGSVNIQKVDVFMPAGQPVQVNLQISYFTPTPCHRLRLVVHSPDAEHRINLEAYSLMKPDQVCTLMRMATPSMVHLSLGSFPAGHYSVWINGTLSAQFDV